MDNNLIINAWTDPVARLALSEGDLAALPAHPAGVIARELSEEEMASTIGGDCGCGWICSVTGECTCDNGITVCSWSGCC